jgi:hypothetical protein
MTVPPRTLESIVEAAEQRRARLAETLQDRRPTDLPLRFWRQHVYFTTPASNGTIARKAVEGGYASALRLFERFGIDAAAVAQGRLPLQRALEAGIISSEEARQLGAV